ncbi:MAG: hypothetical protein ACKOWF_02320 [Chloroflexota bacterium]
MAIRGTALLGSGVVAGLLIAGAGGFALARPAAQDGELCTNNPAIALPMCGGAGDPPGLQPQPQPQPQPEMPGAPPMAPGTMDGMQQPQPVPPPQQVAPPPQQSLTSYASPMGIYSVSWELPWMYVPEASFPAEGAVLLTNGVSDVIFEESRVAFPSAKQFALSINTSGWQVITSDDRGSLYVLGMANAEGVARIVSFKQVGPGGATTDYSVISWLVDAQQAASEAPGVELLLKNVVLGAYGSADDERSNQRVGWANSAVTASLSAVVGTEFLPSIGAEPVTRELAATSFVTARQQSSNSTAVDGWIKQAVDAISGDPDSAILSNTKPRDTGDTVCRSRTAVLPPQCRVTPKSAAPEAAKTAGATVRPSSDIDVAMAAMLAGGDATSVPVRAGDAEVSALQASAEPGGPIVRSERYGFEFEWTGWELPVVQDSASGFDAVLVRGRSLVHVRGLEDASGAGAADIGARRLQQAGVPAEQMTVLRNDPGAFSARFASGSDSGIVSVMQGTSSPGTWQVVLWVAPNDRFAADWPAVATLLSSLTANR